MAQKLLNEFDMIYNDYLIRPDFYRTDVVRPNTFVPDFNMRIRPHAVPVPKKINDVLTKSITKYFLNTTETILEIINLYVKIYEYAINKYIETHPQYDLNTDKIWFALKGGLAMFLSISKEIFKMPGDIGDMFSDLFVKNTFGKSDIDFGILINYSLINQIYHRVIFSDMFNISFIILIIVRNYIIKNKYEFSDFEKNNDEYKNLTLNKIRTDINKALIDDNVGILGDTFCKIGTGKIYEEEPCPNNVDISKDIAYDELYIHDVDNFNNITINHPKRYADLNLTPQNKYIISTNIIRFFNAENNLVKFGLTRMKVFFGLYKLNVNNRILGCCDYKKGKGEIVDVGISHYENHYIHNSINYDKYRINDYEFNMPTINYFKYDHYFMLFDTVEFPWRLPKFEKRLDKYFAFALILLLNNINQQNIQQKIAFFTALINLLLVYNQDPIFDDNPMMNNVFNHPLIDNIQNPVEFEILTLFNKTINNIDRINYNIELINLNIFVAKLSANILNIIQILNRIEIYIQNPSITFYDNNLSIRTNMFGGFNMCSMDNSQKILKNIINKLINITSFTPLNSTINDRFYMTYRKLISIFLNNEPINQIYTDNLNNIIYDSTLDFSDNMLDVNNNRKVLINSNLNITAFMFLNFLIDYHCFLKTFQNERYTTDTNDGSHNFRTLLWNGEPRPKDVYRHELISKNPNILLQDFCNNINTKFYRFINLLLKNLKNTLSTYLPTNLEPNSPPNLTNITIDELKNVMFATNHHNVNKYDNTSVYNYMFHCWKNMLAVWMFNKFNGLELINLSPNTPVGINMENLKRFFITVINKCIRDTIVNISKQNGANTLNETYGADSCGLFQYSYSLLPRLMENQTYNKNTYFGNCIVSSMIEIYFLTRIYESIDDIAFGSESDKNNAQERHAYWTITQRNIFHSISHWTCKWKRLIYQNRVFNNNVHTFRNVYNNLNNRTIWIGQSKRNFLKYFIFIPIDYRIEYIRQNNFISDPINKSIFLMDDLTNKIIEMI